MSEFAAEWSAIKKTALKTGVLPPSLVLSLSQGYDLGPALRTFDKAGKHDERAKAIVAVLKAKTGYLADLRDALREAETAQAKAAVKKMSDALEALWLQVERAAQPPRPSGAMVAHQVLRSFNLAGEVKSKFLDVKATEVTVVVEIDAVLDKLIKDGRESLKIAHLGEVALAELEKVRPAFTQTIAAIEAKIKSGEAPADKKIAEANEVLKHYARIVEDRVDKAVAAEWDKYLARAQHLRGFRMRCAMKITLGAVGIGVAAASLALSFGTAWMSIVAIAKGALELAQTIATLGQGIDKTAAGLESRFKEIDKLNKERDAARIAHGGQKASKTKEAAKELANALLPLTKLMTKGATAVEADAKQLLGQVSKLEVGADKAVGAMNKALKQLDSLPDKGLSVAQSAQIEKTRSSVQTFLDEITALHGEAQRYADLGEKALAAAKKLQSADSWTAGLTATAGGVGTKATAAYAAANFVYQCANAGKGLIPM